jgi:hypothetical protein
MKRKISKTQSKSKKSRTTRKYKGGYNADSVPIQSPNFPKPSSIEKKIATLKKINKKYPK